MTSESHVEELKQLLDLKAKSPSTIVATYSELSMKEPLTEWEAKRMHYECYIHRDDVESMLLPLAEKLDIAEINEKNLRKALSTITIDHREQKAKLGRVEQLLKELNIDALEGFPKQDILNNYRVTIQDLREALGEAIEPFSQKASPKTDGEKVIK